MQVRQTVKLKMKSDFLNRHDAWEGMLKRHNELQAAKVRDDNISRHVLPPADFTTGVVKLNRNISAVPTVSSTVSTRRTRRTVTNGSSQRRYRTVLCRQCSLPDGDHSSFLQAWQLVYPGIKQRKKLFVVNKYLFEELHVYLHCK